MESAARPATVLLVSQPGVMRSALHSILQSLSGAIIMNTDGALSACDLLESQQTDSVVIDANLPLAERVALLARIKRQFPLVFCLALTTTGRHHQLLKEAGADLILMQNCSREDIKRAVFSNNGEHDSAD